MVRNIKKFHLFVRGGKIFRCKYSNKFSYTKINKKNLEKNS